MTTNANATNIYVKLVKTHIQELVESSRMARRAKKHGAWRAAAYHEESARIAREACLRGMLRCC